MRTPTPRSPIGGSRVAVPAHVSRYMVEKGSIAIEGISLTIARWEPGTPEGDVVSVAIIPHTYARTNLHSLKAGQPVNIEADVLIKFMEQRLALRGTCFRSQRRVPDSQRVLRSSNDGDIISGCRVLRDATPPTPPGPEGSNGNGSVRAQ